MLLVLKIDGPPVTGIDDKYWAVDREDCWVSHPLSTLRGGVLKLIWLREQFLVEPLTNVQAQQYARAYILHMIGTMLFPGYSTNRIYL